MQVMANYNSVMFRGVETAVTFFFSFSWSNFQENATFTFLESIPEKGLTLLQRICNPLKG